MNRALHLARRGLYSTHPNPRVGCVLAHGETVIGEGWHQWAGDHHAEIVALSAAGSNAKGATAYVTLEPCNHHGRTPPCTDALIEAGISRVVAAMKDPNPNVAGAGLETLRSAGIPCECGLLFEESLALNIGFVKRMGTGRPYIRSKIAMSLDGRIALASGESQWITGEAAREDVHRLRARSDVIVTGRGTLLADDPRLTARPPDNEPIRQPDRIVLDSQGRAPTTGRFFSEAGQARVLTCRDLAAPGEQSQLDLTAVAQWLGQQEYNEVLFECGPTLNGALLKSGIVDEWVIYMAPSLLGDEARAVFRLPGISRLADCPRLALTDVMAVGGDLRLTFKPESTSSTQAGVFSEPGH